MRTAPFRYIKRYQMELDLRRRFEIPIPVPTGYRLVPWSSRLVEHHAQVKFSSFREELDSLVFPCLGQHESCVRLMVEISERDGFIPEGTWLAQYAGGSRRAAEYCGTIQAIRVSRWRANIQNVGVTPDHRGRGVGAALMLASLWGMQQVGVQRAALEVTAENEGAVRLYRRLGFRSAKTVYKSLEELPSGSALAV